MRRTECQLRDFDRFRSPIPVSLLCGVLAMACATRTAFDEARTLYQQGQYEQAAALYTTLARQYPERDEAEAGLINSLRSKGELTGVCQRLHDYEARGGIAPVVTDANTCFDDLGRHHAAARRWKAAREAYERVALDRLSVERRPEHFKGLVQVYTALNMDVKLIAVFLAILGDNPDDANTHLLLGRLFEKRGEYGKAIQEYNVALELDPSLKDVLQEPLHRAQGRLQAAGMGAASSVQSIGEAGGAASQDATQPASGQPVIRMDDWRPEVSMTSLKVEAGEADAKAVTDSVTFVPSLIVPPPGLDRREFHARIAAGLSSIGACSGAKADAQAFAPGARAALLATQSVQFDFIWDSNGRATASNIEPVEYVRCVVSLMGEWVEVRMIGGYAKGRVEVALP